MIEIKIPEKEIDYMRSIELILMKHGVSTLGRDVKIKCDLGCLIVYVEGDDDGDKSEGAGWGRAD